MDPPSKSWYGQFLVISQKIKAFFVPTMENRMTQWFLNARRGYGQDMKRL